jgi:hypothetical protein
MLAAPHPVSDGSCDSNSQGCEYLLMARELLPPETGRAFTAMKELRTGLTDRQLFVRQVDEIQRPEGYRLVGVVPGGRW